MRGNLYLIAWAKPGDDAHQRAFGDLAQALDGEATQVAYVGAANGDDPGWGKGMIRDLGERHGVAVDFVRTVAADVDPGAARAAIERADLIYLGGGDVSQLVRTFRDRGLEETLRARHSAGAHVLGVSAGAVAMCRAWIEYPDEIPDPPPPFDGGTLLPCFDLAPLITDVHSEEDGWSELVQCLGLLDRDRPDGRPWHGLGIPRGGALIVDSKGAVEELGAPAAHRVAGRGR